MRTYVLEVCLFAALLGCGAGCSRSEGDTLRGHVTAGIPIPDDALANVMEQHLVPAVSIAVIHLGQIDWARGYGICEQGGRKRVDSTTLFQGASISKPVSAVGALRMVEAGTLNLDKDVNDILRSWKVPEYESTRAEHVTVRRLLSHCAGLNVHGVPSYPSGAELPTLVQILNGESPAYTEAIRPVFEPGKEVRYSGGGFVVLQLLMTEVAACDFADLMGELVLQPARMESSTYKQPLPEELRSRAAVGHLQDGSPVKGSWHTYPAQAAGGLWTNPTDMARFIIEVWRSYHGRSEALLSQRLAQRMLTRQVGDCGLGFYLPSAGVFRFQHGGGNVGYRSYFVLSVQSGDGVVIMTNSDSGEIVIDNVFKAIAFAYGWEA